MVCGAIAFRDRRVPVQFTSQDRDPPNSPGVVAKPCFPPGSDQANGIEILSI